jgi:hypothetical protein
MHFTFKDSILFVGMIIIGGVGDDAAAAAAAAER